MSDRWAVALGFVLGSILYGCEAAPLPPTESPALDKPSAAASELAPPAPAAVRARTAPAPENEVVVLRFGKSMLTAEQLRLRLEALPARQRRGMTPKLWRQMAENLALEELVLADALALGVDRKPEIVRQVDALRRRLVVQSRLTEIREVPPPTDGEVRQEYDKKPLRYSTDRVRARHILVKDKKKAMRLRDQVVAAPERFPELAKAHSTDPSSARRGGDLGFFGRGRMVPEFEVVAFELKAPAEISEIVETQYGFHIIQLVERRDGAIRPFEELEEQLRSTLQNESTQAAVESYMAGLRKTSPIEVDEAVLESVTEQLPEPPPPMGH